MATTDNKTDGGTRGTAKRATNPAASAAGDASLRAQTYTDTASGQRAIQVEPWDAEDADALADAYETAGHPIVDAAAWSRSPWLDTALVQPRPPRPPAIDQDWLNERLADLAAHFEDTLRTLKSDDALAELGTRIDTVETRLSGNIAKSMDGVESRLSGSMSKSFDSVEGRLTTAMTKNLAASIQTASGNVPRQVTDAVSGVLASNAMTSVLDRTVNKAVTSAVNGHVANAVTGAVNGAVATAVASAVGGVVTTALTGAVSGRMDEVTSAVTAAVNGSIAPAVNTAVASAVASRIDVLSAAVTSAVNSSVLPAVNSSVNERLDMLTTSMSNAVADAVDDAIAHAVNGALKTTVTEAIADGMHGALSDQIGDAVTHAVSGAMTGGMSQAIEGAVTSTVSGAVADALSHALPSALADVATKADIDGLYSVQTTLNHVLDRFDRADERLARIDEIEGQMQDITDRITERLSDERMSQLIGNAGGGGASAADIDHAARTASDMVAQEMLARMPAAGHGDNGQIDDIRTLLETVISEQRQGDEMTSTMLDTLQQAMLAVLDRVDALETTAARMTATASAAIADQGANRNFDRDQTSDADPISTNDPDEIAARIDRMAIADESRQAARAPARVEPSRVEAGRSDGEQPRAQRRPGADNPVSDRLPMRAPGANRNIEQAKPAEPQKEEFVNAARRSMRSTSGRDGDGEANTPSSSSSYEGRTPPRARSLASDTPSGTTPSPRGKTDRRALVAIIAVLALGAGYQLTSRTGTDATIQQAEADRPAIASADTAPRTAEVTAIPAVAGDRDAATTDGQVIEARLADATPAADQTATVPQGVVLTGGGQQLSPQAIMALRQREEAARMSAQVGSSAYQLQASGTRLPMGVTPAAATSAAPVMSALERHLAAGATVVGRAAPSTTASVTRPSDIELPAPSVGPLSFRRAAQLGDASAQFEVAARLAEGRGTPQDFPGAILWYTRAADQGFAAAQFRLATMYERGLGVTADIGQAKVLYNRAADRGHVKAMHNLAVLAASEKTADGEPNYAAALPWFQRAAAHGLTDSQFNLAVLLESGLGLSKDLGAAYKWQSLAARGGDKQALVRRDALAKQLEPAAREVIDREVTSFRAAPTDRIVNDARAAGEAWKTRAAGAT